MAVPKNYRWYPALTGLFVVSLVVSNIIAAKLALIGPLVLPAAIIIFPIAYILGDVLTEVYGYARARQVIWIGFLANLLAVAAIWISINLPAAPIWGLSGYTSPGDSQKAFAAVLGFTPRLLAASFAAYLVGEFLNSFVLARLKVATQGRYLWTRTIGSTLVGQFADSLIFISIAFFGLPAIALLQIALTQWLVKSAYETLVTPLTYVAVNALKRAENEDYYDRDTNFNPLAVAGQAGQGDA